jgi:phosphopantetheine adenylyltransferase
MDREKNSMDVLAEIGAKAAGKKRVVFVSGNFNIVHPGHLRLLQFAADCGDFLVVGERRLQPRSDGAGGNALDGVRAIGIVGHAFLLQERPEEFIPASSRRWW